MKNKFGIVYCANIEREVKAAIPKDIIDEIVLKSYDTHCNILSAKRVSSDEAFIDLSSICDNICLFGCGCPSALNPPSVNLSAMNIHVQKGAELFLPADVVHQLYQRGSYLVTSGWINKWQDNLQCHFSNLDIAQQMFGETINEVVLLNTGQYSDSSAKLNEFTDFLKIPGRTINVGIEYLSILIEKKFLAWKLSKERNECEVSIREAGKKLADYILISDFLGDIARLQDENKIIQKIEEIYTLLMSPEQFSYRSCPYKKCDVTLKNEFLKENYGLSEVEISNFNSFHISRNGDGFIYAVRFQDEFLGVISVNKLAFPRYLNDYLNASKFIVRVFALALHNSTIYKQLNDIITKLDSEVATRRQAQEELLISNKKLNLLTSITRHDMNNYLAVQLGYLELLDRNELGPKNLNYLNKIENAAEQIATMIRFTKEYEEIGITSAQWHDIRKVVDTASEKLKMESILLINDLPPGQKIHADPMISKVFYNLIDNSLRYAGKATYIRFSIMNDGEGAVVVCEDNGFGIPDNEKEKIFKRGFGKNTGLGLFLSKEILSITGLELSETGKFGEGAKFEIRVPKNAFREV